MIEYLSSLFTPTILLYLLRGFAITLRVAAIAIVLSILFGTILGLIRSYAPRPLRKIAGAYIEWFRNTPNLLWVMVCFIAAPLPSDWARCTMAYVLFTSAMMAEIVRGGLNAIPKGQFEACRALGLNKLQTMRKVIIPQAALVAVPSLGNSFISLLKDTSLVSTITVAEIMMTAKSIIAIKFQPLLFYCEAAVVYLIFSTVLTQLQGMLEKKLGKHLVDSRA